eukprot:TRINITY_DN3695_c0_g1_i1.p1 TRINITY_DN3695_c0_g1~~TRINITY_DN3695_c0_g1_i1.p1  ORF type:complete len:441 (+),score=126.52 TRINITY_DN3695_c0_g1_i1:119-1324(+)
MSVSIVDKISIKFIEKYYASLTSKQRDMLLSFYQPHSTATWGDETGGQNSKTTATGKEELNQLFDKYSFEEEVEISIRTVDSQSTPQNGILLSVIGVVTLTPSDRERRFSQTFFLLPFPGTDNKRYYVCNDLLRYHSEGTNKLPSHSVSPQSAPAEKPKEGNNEQDHPLVTLQEENQVQLIQEVENENVDVGGNEEKDAPPQHTQTQTHPQTQTQTQPKEEHFKKPEKFSKRFNQSSNYQGKQKQYVPKQPQYKQVNKTPKYEPKGTLSASDPESQTPAQTQPQHQPQHQTKPQHQPQTQPQQHQQEAQSVPPKHKHKTQSQQQEGQSAPKQQHKTQPSQPPVQHQPPQAAGMTYAQILSKPGTPLPIPPPQDQPLPQPPQEKQPTKTPNNPSRGRGRKGT